MPVKIIDWAHCYGESWSGEIVADAFQHPAKYSRALIRRIYAHLIEQGYLAEGQTVIDPFGGVALGAFEAMIHGCDWIGCELEQKFVDLGCANIALWNKHYAGKFRKWGTAKLMQGDSRELLAVLGRNGFDGNVDAAISSPPFMEAQSGGGINRKGYGDGSDKVGDRTYNDKMTGSTPGQLSTMKPGQLDVAVSSPPYEGARIGNESGQAQVGHSANYGPTPGQLGNMPASAVVSSPPYEASNQAQGGNQGAGTYHGTDLSQGLNRVKNNYAELGNDNLGNARGETFWDAARQIVAQTYQVLKPGAYAAWVVKAFVRNKAIVDFPGRWQSLCEACGFETVEYIRAWLVEDKGTTIDLDGNHKKKTVKRISFFRRLAEAKGSPRIDFEVVLIMRKSK